MDVDREIDLTISTIWMEERISCPPRDDLQKYVAGELDTDHADYIRFHILDIGCPYCQASEEDLRMQGPGHSSEEEVRKRLLHSTTQFLQKQRKV